MKITKVRFFEYGKKAPKNSRFKGDISNNTVGGYFDYTGREESKDVEKDIEKQEDGYFGYTGSHSVGTMSSIGELNNQNDRKAFKKEINKYFKTNGNLCWDFVISLENDEEAQKLGLETAQDWNNTISEALPKIFKQYGLNYNNTVWWFDVHRNTEHPHIHLAFMEKNQTRFRGKITKTQLENTKRCIYTVISGRKKLKEKTGIDYKDYFKIKDQTFNSLVTHIKGIDLDKEASINYLYKHLPKSGRLQYNAYNMKPFQPMIKEIINNLIENDDELKSLFNSYMDKIDVLESIMNDEGGNVATLKEAEMNKLYERVGNYILQNFKKNEYINDQSHNSKQNNRKSHRTRKFLSSSRLKGYIYSIALQQQSDIEKAIDEYNQRMEENMLIK